MGVKKLKKRGDPYQERFNEMGLELPETVTANPASMRNVATFLVKYKVFEADNVDLAPLLEGADRGLREAPE